MAEGTGDPYDIDGQYFNEDMYFQKVFKEYSLKQIMDLEADIIKNTQILNSDMQTLVYENYNKFISATDTIRKMKSDFSQMEESMDSLAKNMDSITSFSEQIASTLQGTRHEIAKLSSIHTLLKKLQFLFKLPSNLKDEMNSGNYNQAVKSYLHAQRVLNRYGNMPSFQGIQKDCEEIVDKLKLKLRAQLQKREASTKSLTETVDFLLQLKEPADSLCADFLTNANFHLSGQLETLKDMCENDLIEFVTMSCSGFLSDLCLIVASYNDMFINRPSLDENEFNDDLDNKVVSRLNTFIMFNMKNYFELIAKRVEDVNDTGILVRALDKFHKRLQTMNNLCDQADFVRSSIDIIINAGRKQCRNHLHSLKQHLTESLAKVRQTLAAKTTSENDGSLIELQATLVMPIIERIKGVLQDLLVFLQSDLSFSSKLSFLQSFCVDEVRENLVVGFLHHLTIIARGFCTESDVPKFPLTLLLLLSKMCLEFKDGNVHYLLAVTDDMFNIEKYDKSNKIITPESEICENFQSAAQTLLDHYVRLQGLAISQMLRKSVETRDWLHTIEPRTVRAVMKRVVEDITAIESQVTVLYDDSEVQVDRSSDSSRRTHSVNMSRHQYRSNWSSSHLDSSLVTNIQKLFSERIEIFSSVQFNKASILTGIIKISLKSFLECVRLRTFSKYGLQQIQVDTHYLQLYLWRFVTDENLVHFLLDEILGSAVHRCLEPVLMEPSVVDIICERN